MDTNPFDARTLRDQLVSTFRLATWRAASKHRNGTGLEDGVYLQPTLQYMNTLRKHGEHEQAGWLNAIASAALWPDDRLAAAGYPVTPRCHRCGAATDSEFHRVWLCPAIDTNRPTIKATQHLASQLT